MARTGSQRGGHRQTGRRYRTILWCGNTGPVIEDVQDGNLAEVYGRLNGTGRAPNRYQDLYTVVIPESGAARFIKSEYGGPSTLD